MSRTYYSRYKSRTVGCARGICPTSGRSSCPPGRWAPRRICAADQITPPEVLDLVSRLVEKSLVVTEDRTDGRRFRLLETLRQYAEEQLHIAGEETGLLRRYVRWHQALAEKGQVGLRGPNQGKWRDRLEAELDDIRSAIRWI